MRDRSDRQIDGSESVCENVPDGAHPMAMLSAMVVSLSTFYPELSQNQNHVGDEAFGTALPRNVRLSEAPSYGLPIHLYDARCNGAKAYQALAKELIDRNEV